MFWILMRNAMAQETAAPAAQPSLIMQLVPFAVMLGVMYFLVLRPQQKKQAEHRQFVSNLKRGDEIVTISGILGRIEGITDRFVTLEVADGVRVKMLRSQVAGSASKVTGDVEAKA